MSATEAPSVQGDNAVKVLSHLVEKYPSAYMAVTSHLVREEVDRRFSTSMDTNEMMYDVSDALLATLTKLLVAPNSDDQIRVSTNVNASLLHLCKYDPIKYNKGRFASLNLMWRHVQQNASRELSSAQIRVASLMIDVCLLGDEEFSHALLEAEDMHH